ncbi:MAG TPA: DUF1559 domain-containing protein [Abditibacteriaceae bacterium]
MKYVRPLLVLLIVGGFLLIGYSWLNHARGNARRSSCASNIKNIALGFYQYVQDNDNRFPLVASASQREVEATQDKWGQPTEKTRPFGWVDALQPYLKSTSIFNCPSETIWPEDWRFTRPQFTDYWMNGQLSGIRLKSISNPSRVFLSGDGDGRDADSTARYNKVGLPTKSYDATQPIWTQRHIGGANYAFVDGHVEWLKPDEISAEANAPHTFSPK